MDYNSKSIFYQFHLIINPTNFTQSYKPITKATTRGYEHMLLIAAADDDEVEKVPQERVKLTLKSHDCKAMVKTSREHMHEGIPVD